MCIEQTGIAFDDFEEFERVVDYLFFDIAQNSRFIHKHAVKSESNTPQKKEAQTFDWFIDSDAIYANFVKNYGHLVKTPSDLEQMDFFQFKMLFDNMASTLSDRVQIRQSKPPKKPKTTKGGKQDVESLANHREQVIQHKKSQMSVYLNDEMRFK